MAEKVQKDLDYLKGRFAFMEHLTLMTIAAFPDQITKAIINNIKNTDISALKENAMREGLGADFAAGMESQFKAFLKMSGE